jgi:hypothetical protein
MQLAAGFGDTPLRQWRKGRHLGRLTPSLFMLPSGCLLLAAAWLASIVLAAPTSRLLAHNTTYHL